MPKLGQKKRRELLLKAMLDREPVGVSNAEDSWALVELYRLQHGELPPQSGEGKTIQISEGLKALAKLLEGDSSKYPPLFSVVSVLRYAAKELAKQDDLTALSEKVARLNPEAGEIGPGMLANLVAKARRITPPTPPV